MFDIHDIRKQFPILSQMQGKRPLLYFDNAATTQKPLAVIQRESELYFTYNSNIHRGVHSLSSYCTDEYEKARSTVASYLGTPDTGEIIFTSGATDSINLVSYSLGEEIISTGDHILVSAMEHHANFVPWQQLCKRKNAVLDLIPILPNGTLDLGAFQNLLQKKPKIVAIAHVSNVLGVVNPVKEITRLAHDAGSVVLIDGAQAVPHGPVDMKDMDCDFYVFSGHKLYSPTGIGVLYGKRKLLENMPPFRYGGDMVDQVSFESTTFNQLPFKFEAGTTNYIGAIAMGSAIEFLNNIGWKEIHDQETLLATYGWDKLASLEFLTIIGPEKRVPLFSLIFNSMHPLDVGTLLDKMGVAVRTGTQCAQPLLSTYNTRSVLRASLAFYNSLEEIDIFVESLKKAHSMLS